MKRNSDIKKRHVYYGRSSRPPTFKTSEPPYSSSIELS